MYWQIADGQVVVLVSAVYGTSTAADAGKPRLGMYA